MFHYCRPGRGCVPVIEVIVENKRKTARENAPARDKERGFETVEL
jgi:hypothetical protein